MKKTIYIFYFLVLAANSIYAQNNHFTCAAEDCLKLQEPQVADNFFQAIDAWYEQHLHQKGSDVMDIRTFPPINAEILARFMSSIESETFKHQCNHIKQYHFDLAPEGYLDLEICSDAIRLSFDPESCIFNLGVYNSFFVKDFGCSETYTTYQFTIENDEVQIHLIGAAG